MGLPKQLAKVILAEHVYRPIKGNLLLIGRQRVSPSEAEVRSYLREFDIAARGVPIEYDFDTRRSAKLGNQGFISDKSFFALFSDAVFNALDVTDYEKATVIHDMNLPVPDAHKGRYDFIYNGSCMDNLFNPAQFLINCSDLLADGGRVIHLEFASLWPGAYIAYTGGWFNDYYALNNFVDCKVFYARFRRNHIQERWVLSQLVSVNDENPSRLVSSAVWSPRPHLLVVIAEKGKESTAHKMPIQLKYRPNDQHRDSYLEACRRFDRIDRYPRGFGRPVAHARSLKSTLDDLWQRPPFFTRSKNLRQLQTL